MFWRFIALAFALGIGIPVLKTIYDSFTADDGILVNMTACVTGNATPITDFELGYWRVMPFILALIILGVIFVMFSGRFENKESKE